MNHVNRLIGIAFLFTIIGDQIWCHEENPKLTVELMSSGFHRFEFIVNGLSLVKCELIILNFLFFFSEIWSMWSFFQNIRANIIHSSLNNNCRLLFTLVPINWMIWNDSTRYTIIAVQIRFILEIHLRFALFQFSDQLFPWQGFRRYRNADREVRTISYSFVWNYSIFANHFIAHTF